MTSSAGRRDPKVFGRDTTRTVFVLRHRFQKPPEAFEEAYGGHRAFIERNLKSGTFLAAGPAVPWDGGVILAVAADRAAVERLIAADPLVEAGITAYEATEWKTTVRGPGFDAMLDAAGTGPDA